MLHSDSRSRAWVEVGLPALRSNVAAIAGHLGQRASIMAVVKADAYGHGLIPTAQEVVKAGAIWLGVATVNEGALLREANITTPIALLSAPATADAADIVALQLAAMVGDTAILEALNTQIAAYPNRILRFTWTSIPVWSDREYCRKTPFHFGSLPGRWEFPWKAYRRTSPMQAILTNPTHISSFVHLNKRARACTLPAPAFPGCTSTTALRLHPSRFPFPLLPRRSAPATSSVRACSSTGSLNDTLCMCPDFGTPRALSLKARVVVIRELPANHAIGYRSYTPACPEIVGVATISIGYGDGYPRALSNRGFILVRGARAPILGSVCMDQTVVDVTDIPEAAAGDEAVCIGEQLGEAITVSEISERTGAIEHEITTGLTARLPRVYLPEGSRIK